MKIIQRSPIRNSGVGAKKGTALSKNGAFQAVMDEQETAEQGAAPVAERETSQRQSQQQQQHDNADVMLMLVRQGIDVLDDGLFQIEREGLLSGKEALSSKLGKVRQQLHQLRQSHGGSPLLDDTETILNVESERLRQLA